MKDKKVAALVDSTPPKREKVRAQIVHTMYIASYTCWRVCELQYEMQVAKKSTKAININQIYHSIISRAVPVFNGQI